MTESALLLWGVGLLAVALVLLALEFVVPSGGLIAVASGLCAIASIICFWRVGTTWGLSALLAVLVLSPTAIGFGLKVWPNTYFGRRMILGGEDEDAARRQREQRQQTAEIKKALIGARGVALTDLRPVGSVRIEDDRVEALAEGGMIPAGASVRVTAVEGNQIRVRQVV